MNYFAPLIFISFSSVVFCCEINLPSPKTHWSINAPTKKTICFHSDSVVIVKDRLFKLHQSEKNSDSNNVMFDLQLFGHGERKISIKTAIKNVNQTFDFEI